MYRIQLIDDDPDVLSMLTEMLQMAPYEVSSSSSGSNGLKQALIDPPDLVLCDMSMPGWDGLETMKQFRAHPNLLHIPFVFLSARTEESQRRMGMEWGAEDYLYKPIRAHNLFRVLDTQLTKYKRIKGWILLLEEQQNQIDHTRYATDHQIRGPLSRMLGLMQMLQLEEDLENPRFTRQELTEWIFHSCLELESEISQMQMQLDQTKSLGLWPKNSLKLVEK